MLGLLALVVIWFLAMDGGGGGSEGDQSEGAKNGQTPTADATITPGPTPSGPHIGQRPGGRGDSGGGGTGGGTGGSGDRAGSGGGSGAAGGAGGAAAAAGGFGGGPGLAVTGDGKPVAAVSSLPDCTPGAVRLSVRSVKDSYRPDEKPKFELVVKNSGGSACKVNFGATAAMFVITDDKGEEHVWNSGDCVRGTAAVLFEVPGSGETKRTVEWDRRRSAPQCATPSGPTAAVPGTYRVEVKVAGVTDRTEFTLEKA